MATKTRAKRARTTGRRTKPAARKRSAKRGKVPKHARGRAKAGATNARAARARKPAARASAQCKTAPRAAPRPAAASAASRELAALKVRFQREKTALEKRLTESVREIGQLRHHEARAVQLERQLKERDETIGQLRSQLSELRNRDLAPPEDEEVQPSLALGEREPHDLDFDEEVDPEDEDDELI
jgi:predicted RNase H-like nuclease (RuvC/YqgF family)